MLFVASSETSLVSGPILPESISRSFVPSAAPIEPPRKNDRQLALFEPGVCLRDLESSTEAHRASEATEATLQQVEVRL